MRLWIIALLASGCGRIGFGPLADDPGELLPIAPFRLSELGLSTCIEMAWSGQDLAVFWVDLFDNRLRFARVAPDGTTIVPERLLGLADAFTCPAAVWTGTSYALAWSINGGDIALGFVDTAGAETADLTVALSPDNEALGSVAWDGNVIGVGYMNVTTMTTYFRAFAADATPLGGAVAVTPGAYLGSMTALATGGFALVQGLASGAEYLELGATGNPTTTPVVVAERPYGVHALARGPDQFAVAYEALDFSATVRTGTPALANPPYLLGLPQMIGADMVSLRDGFVLAWIEDTTGEYTPGELRFTRLDAMGTPVTPIYHVADGSSAVSMAALDDTTLAIAFTEGNVPKLAVFQTP